MHKTWPCFSMSSYRSNRGIKKRSKRKKKETSHTAKSVLPSHRCKGLIKVYFLLVFARVSNKRKIAEWQKVRAAVSVAASEHYTVTEIENGSIVQLLTD